jgi:hypothetical protein
MKHIAILAALLLVGCAHHEDHFTPPSSVEVQRNIARVAPFVRAEGKEAYIDLQKSLADYQAQVEKQTQLLDKAEKDAIYWHQKQEKALKELWIWRSIAIASILCVAGYLGLKTSWRLAI